ncbi:transcription factor DIVARICATA-like [Ananas comosus]|uniref:Transcription factor MYBS1 n=1 Tax=Ananas comosus TaxID=4615 RepID=A0A6P5G7P0_ANACO|nr:transcription factor DIVARICATA-like [Ananas comosus]
MMMQEAWMEVLPPAAASCFPASSLFLSEMGMGMGMGMGKGEGRGKGNDWSPEENKVFEEALARIDGDRPDRWERVAEMIPGKTVADVISQYQELENDVSYIEAGLIPFPHYDSSSSFVLDWEGGARTNHSYCCVGTGTGTGTGKRSGPRGSSDQERKKGVPWTEEEHKRFLMGLKKHGKGDWRNISRNFVFTRNPTQVASHAQKYYNRLNSGGKDKRRSSIHDITTVNLPDDRPPSPSQSSSSLSMLTPQPSTGNAAASPLSDQYSAVLDPSRPNEAASAFKLSEQHPFQFVQSPLGAAPYGTVKIARESSYSTPPRDAAANRQSVLFQVQPFR